MLEGLSKKITGDWVELSEASLSLASIIKYLKLSDPFLKDLIQELQKASEEGVVELKLNILNSVLNFLADLNYSTPDFSKIEQQQKEIDKILLVCLIQRLFASGSLSVQEHTGNHKEEITEKDLKLILADIMGRLRDNPQLKNNTSVKLILTQLAIYQRENETMKKLQPNITDQQKMLAFKKNFQQTFAKLADNIRKYYADFLAQEQMALKANSLISLQKLPIRDLLSLFTKQAREFLRLRSTLLFALQGKYKVREICVHLSKEKKAFLELVEQEKKAYHKIIAQAKLEKDIWGGDLPALLFANELVSLLQKQLQTHAS